MSQPVLYSKLYDSHTYIVYIYYIYTIYISIYIYKHIYKHIVRLYFRNPNQIISNQKKKYMWAVSLLL